MKQVKKSGLEQLILNNLIPVAVKYQPLSFISRQLPVSGRKCQIQPEKSYFRTTVCLVLRSDISSKSQSLNHKYVKTSQIPMEKIFKFQSLQ